MSIIVRHVARVELPKDETIKAMILSMYSYTNRFTGQTLLNYTYKKDVCYLAPNMEKLKIVASILGEDIVDDRSKGSPLGEPFVLREEFKLREYQVEPAAALVAHLKEHKYGVLQAPCGAGKSTVVSYAAGFLGVKILILIDMGSLIQSWQESMHNVWGREVQVLNSKTETFGAVSISTFQMLYKNPELVQRISKEYGMTIIDECHRIKAETFKGVLSQLNNAFRCSTTATFYTKNMPVGLLEDYTSSVSCKMLDTKSLVPLVHFVETGVAFPSDNPMDFASLTTPSLARDMKRMAVVLRLMKQCYADDRRTIIIGITTEQARMIKMFADKLGAPADVYVGATSQKRDKAVRDDFAAGKISFLIVNRKADAGLDLPSASALIITRPSNNKREITQVSGRILRTQEDKKEPWIFDLVDSGDLAGTFMRNRLKWYKELGYSIAL